MACNSGNTSSKGNAPSKSIVHRQTIHIKSGSNITYNTGAQDVLIRILYGGGKVGTLELTPEVSIYGNGTFIIGPGLQLKSGALSSNKLQNLLYTLVTTDNLLQQHRQVFADIPDQNVTLLQMALNGKNYQFVYGPFGNLQEGSQDMQEYQQLGQAIAAIRNTLKGPVKPYTSFSMAFLAYQTFRIGLTETQNQAIPYWNLTSIDLANAAIYECGTVPPDNSGPNADTGCLVFTTPRLAVLPDQQDLGSIMDLLSQSLQGLLQENGNDYVAMLRPLLPDEIAMQKVVMYGSDLQNYNPTFVPLKTGTIPVPQTAS